MGPYGSERVKGFVIWSVRNISANSLHIVTQRFSKSRLHTLSYLKVPASSLPVVESIKMIFHVNDLGSLPDPIAQTCAASIDLRGGGYASFNDFRVEMESLLGLNNELSWTFTSL